MVRPLKLKSGGIGNVRDANLQAAKYGKSLILQNDGVDGPRNGALEADTDSGQTPCKQGPQNGVGDAKMQRLRG